MKKRLLYLLLINTFVFTFPAQSQTIAPPPVLQESWSKDVEPFRIAGNLYYVGTEDLACYLVATPQGHILINTGLAESASMIRSHIEKLGFKFSDIKIITTTQAHYDHEATGQLLPEQTRLLYHP